MATDEVLAVRDDISLYEEIFAVAHHLYERSGRKKGHDHDNFIEAERIVRALRKIAGDDGRRYILVNVPEEIQALKRQNKSKVVISCKKVAHRAIKKA